MNKILLIKVQDVIENSDIEKSVDEKLVRITILKSQDTRLEPVLTQSLYDKILKDYADLTLTGAYKTLLFDKIRPFLIHAVVLDISDKIRYKYQNLGINKEKSENSETISYQEHENMKKEKYNDLVHYKMKLIEYIEKNKDSFPEYNSDDDESEQGIDVGLFLG